MGRDRLAQGLQPPRLAQPGHRGAEEEGLGDGGADREDIATVLHEAHERQVEEVMDTLEEGPEGLYEWPPY